MSIVSKKLTNSDKRRILLYSSNIWYFGEGMLGPLLAVFTNRIGGNILDVAWAWAIFLIVTGILSLLFGHLSDKMSKEKMMVVGYSLNAILTFSYIFVDSPIKLFCVQAGLGLATALATPTWDALYAKYQDKNKSGHSWGLVSGQSKTLTGIAILIGGWIITILSFNILFIIMGIIQAIAAIYAGKLLTNKNTH